MKKAKSVKSSSATKTTAKKAAPKRPPKKTPPRTVDEYLARVPEPARNALTKIRAAIRSAVPPEATETISYRMPAFKHKRTLVWYAAFSNHCSLFPTAAVIEAFKDELKGFSTTKGTIHFSLDKPMPVALIKKLVKARVAES
ncbi:MAG: iron chaperone [Candidatus Angelobacter sp.]